QRSAGAEAGRAQFGLGTEPRRGGDERSGAERTITPVHSGRDWRLSLRPANPGVGFVERTGQSERFVVRENGAEEQAATGACAVAEGVRVGARGGSAATPDERSLARRLVESGQAGRDSKDPTGRERCDLVPQLRWTGGVRKAHPVAAGVEAADSLHGIHGK